MYPCTLVLELRSRAAEGRPPSSPLSLPIPSHPNPLPPPPLTAVLPRTWLWSNGRSFLQVYLSYGIDGTPLECFLKFGFVDASTWSNGACGVGRP